VGEWNAPSQSWVKKNPAIVPVVMSSAFAYDESNGTVLFAGRINLYTVD
jgi:hypothetical protein